MKRHEIKYVIPFYEQLRLKSLLEMIMERDPHCRDDGTYELYSLYFDTEENTAFYDKVNGVSDRVKYRLRLYNRNKELIKLEKKSKHNNTCFKEHCIITSEEAMKLQTGDIGWMLKDKRKLINELYYNMVSKNLSPKSVVRYIREPFIYQYGNVRITFDTDIGASISSLDILDFSDRFVRITDFCVMEVKYSEFIPDIIREAIYCSYDETAFSKYENSRLDLK